MGRTGETRRATVRGTAMAVAAAVTLGGCGAGQVAQTANQVTTSGGALGSAGPMLVRDAQITWTDPVPEGSVYEPGEDAPLQVTIVNTGRDGDRLVAVSSPVATSGEITGDAAVPGEQVLVAGYDDPVSSIAVPGATAIDITLVGITDPVRAGLTYPVVFTFERAGDLRVELPVEYADVLPPRAREPEPEQEVLDTGPEIIEVPG